MAEQLNSQTPKIRFKGFEEEWVENPLGKIVHFLDERRKPLKAESRKAGSYPYYGASGIIDYVEGYLFDERLLLLSEDGANIIDRNYPICFIAEGKYWVNNHAHVLRPNVGFSDLFIRDSLERLNFEQFNTGTAQPKLNQEVCRNISIKITEPAEQTKIGNYFRELDQLIGLQQCKHVKLVTLKKAMLQKMFPQPSATTPKIRFKDFEGAWEKKTLGESTFNIASNSLSRANLNYHSGLAKNVHYGDILIKYGEVLDVQNDGVPFISDYALARKPLHPGLQDGDVVMADAAEDETVGKCTEIQNVGDNLVLAGLHTIAMRPCNSFAPFYLGYYLNTKAFHNQLLRLMQGTKVLSISKTVIRETIIYFPTDKSEQQKIGTYFRTLDELISKYAIQLQKLKQIKSACLEKMFV